MKIQVTGVTVHAREGDGDGSGRTQMSVGGGESLAVSILRRWPVVVLVTAAAVGAAVVALERRAPTYKATTSLLITPLPQWDTTFLGTSLIRDSGDANRTAATVAQMLDSQQVAEETARRLGGSWTSGAVRAAVDVSPLADTNVIGMTAHADTRVRAVKLAHEFAAAALVVHWRTVARQLATRIYTIATVRRTTAPRNADLTHDLALLRALRLGGHDPTLTLRDTSAATRTGISAVAVGILALVGGLFLGGVAAAAIAWMPRSSRAKHTAGSAGHGERDTRTAPNVFYKPE